MSSAGSGASTPQRSVSGDESDSDLDNEQLRPRGLTGLQNLGNTCYLNSAVQSLSHCPPLTQYFLDCAPLIRPDKSPQLSRSYLKLMMELWHKKRQSYVVPSGVVSGIKAVHPMFRGYTQQDAQEFLRCLMDQLHEELKVAAEEGSCDDSDDSEGEGPTVGEDTNNANSAGDQGEGAEMNTVIEVPRRPSIGSMSSQSELDYETCDSGLSSEQGYPGERDEDSDGDGNGDVRQVANTKEMKETANLLEKQEIGGQRIGRVMEGGDYREQGTSPSRLHSVNTKEGGVQTISSSPLASPPRPASPYAELSGHSLHPHKTKPERKKPAKKKKPQHIKYDSIISQTFDGQILSSVRCMTCETVSTTRETFQDLSLPIPSKDHLTVLHQHPVGGVAPPKGGACGEVHQGWVSWAFGWMRSWFVGPVITLQDCLSAFFSADELKGDNMYSCEKCRKLRNGLKYSKVLELPEILSIHLKRFRHEFYSSKVSTYVYFPLEGLDMTPYLHKDCKNEVTKYDLVSIICHHGTAGGGHYTAYCLNHVNKQWYEFDDQYVTEVDISQVVNCEAYVLFYRKSNKKIESLRNQVNDVEQSESILKFHLSKAWISRFQTFAEPGPITNHDFLCRHGGVPPVKVALINDLRVEVHQDTWELLHRRCGGGPVCNHLAICQTCHVALEELRARQAMEKETFIQLNEEFQEEEQASAVYAISMAWFKTWEAFVREKADVAPGPIDNTSISLQRPSPPSLKPSSDHGQLSADMWFFLHRIYGGGPELLVRPARVSPGKPASPTQACSPPTQRQRSSVSVGSAPVASPTKPLSARQRVASASASPERPDVHPVGHGTPSRSPRTNATPSGQTDADTDADTCIMAAADTDGCMEVSTEMTSPGPEVKATARGDDNLSTLSNQAQVNSRKEINGEGPPIEADTHSVSLSSEMNDSISVMTETGSSGYSSQVSLPSLEGAVTPTTLTAPTGQRDTAAAPSVAEGAKGGQPVAGGQGQSAHVQVHRPNRKGKGRKNKKGKGMDVTRV